MKNKIYSILVPLLVLVFSSAVMAQKTDVENKDRIFSQVDKEPEFPGGNNALYKFLAQNIRYPAVDRKNNVQGRAIVQFIVEKDGSLSDVKVIRSPSETIADESKRVMALSPHWVPGTQKDQQVRVMYTIPINFTLGKAG